jgi:hypothetical protein
VKAGGTKEQILKVESETPYFEISKYSISDLLDLFKQYFHLPDTGHIELTLATIAANRGSGDPIWLLIIAPPSSGKTEPLNTVIGQHDIFPVAVLTEASLLSGTPRKDIAKGAKGGLLAEMGDFGILLIKDFSGMLSLNKDSRSSIMSALREIYDGAWTRYVGVEGGKKLEWHGKCGLIGAATPSIDQHYAVLNTLGERFCYYRMEQQDEDKRAEIALLLAGQEHRIRESLVNAVNKFFDGLQIVNDMPFLSEDERKKLIALAMFTVRCRSSVDRENYQTREIQLIPGIESPTRIVKVFALLFRGLLNIGVTRERSWTLIENVAFSSMPALRKNVLAKMLESQNSTWTTRLLATELGYPSNTTRRTLEDMTCYGIIERTSQGEGNSDIWKLSDWTTTTHKTAFQIIDLTRNSGSIYSPLLNSQNSQDRISGKVGYQTQSNGSLNEVPEKPCPICDNEDFIYNELGQPVCANGHIQEVTL